MTMNKVTLFHQVARLFTFQIWNVDTRFNKIVPKMGKFFSKSKYTVLENQDSLQSLEMLGQPRTQWSILSSNSTCPVGHQVL